MALRPLPEQSILLQLLRYDRRSGKLYWRERLGSTRGIAIFNSQFAGKEAGKIDTFGYVVVTIYTHHYRAHRLIWKMVNDADPIEIDHRNGVRSDNRWRNLREGPRSINTKNCRMRLDNTSGHTGVCFDKTVWRAQIYANGKCITLGYFKQKRDAIRVRRAAEIEHGYSKRHGRRKS